MPSKAWFDVAPSAARLTGSLRDIGYDFPTAVADIVDNSVAAGATRVEIMIEFAGSRSRVYIADDGHGMSPGALLEGLRLGTRRAYTKGELGRYGLGLKTASLSQCRSVAVISRNTPDVVRTCARVLDLDVVEEWDQWVVVDPGADPDVARAKQWLAEGTGTVVLWRDLDRVLPEKRPEGGWARRRLEALAAKTAEHLGIVFHRFLEGAAGRTPLVITVNGQKVRAWNPFAPEEAGRSELPAQRFEITVGDVSGHVDLRRFILPSRDRFSSTSEFERLSGPLNWNRQQGLYVYRADRLVQWGGWSAIRGIDEHTKMARASLDFSTDLDSAFNINVAKMKVALPAQLRQMLEAPVNELCIYANDAYRRSARTKAKPVPADLNASADMRVAIQATATAGLALRAAAMQAGEWDAWQRIAGSLCREAPEIAQALGLDS
ncbi:Histidine kinase-, DNA gyrase B-, and HSP90-like ATPase [Micromonospora purpureochromogenes]|uniref:Histidine kinase-, DNA gyrase B-, and HSP90-like ATPase n=1 Tax=Micromonospora purpureochromogenes TaxID=47872 RepID=A0A1C5A8J5_9ACTN|nr:ATP-binding protein [Micromonospora purpureochromogenes]SCF41489.1 Histidine kinase-, DNA gyrase B-, and HSP90-like ATPase [Micromonospora purpureochromogenes]